MAGIFCGSEFYVSVVIHEILSTKILRQVSTVVPSAIVTCTEVLKYCPYLLHVGTFVLVDSVQYT